MQDFFSFRLRNAPRPVKFLAGSYILALSLAYVYALGNIALVIGLTPKEVATHYYGAEKRVDEAPAAAPSGEESLDLDAVEAEKPQIGPRPSFKNLVGAGHFHLFGMSSFFFGLTLLGLFVSVKESTKVWLVTAPFVTVVLDNLSFMATRFLGPEFAYLIAMSGALMGLSFSALWILIAIELTKKPETR